MALLGSLGFRSIGTAWREIQPGPGAAEQAGSPTVAWLKPGVWLGEPREFYAEVARALRGFIADKLNVAEAGMQMTDMEMGPGDAGVSEAVQRRSRLPGAL